MNDFNPSKENPEAPPPGFAPMPGPASPPNYGPPTNTMYSPASTPNYGPPTNTMYNTAYTHYAVNHPMHSAVHPYGQHVVVTTQPTMFVTQLGTYANDYLGYSIFTMLCCCLPIGIAALVFSINTRDANNRADSEQARKSSNMALILNNVALGLGIACAIAWVTCVIYFNIAARQYYSNYYG
ncbi:proline rich transmembrane protein 1B-like [Ambystoma mexicanum]|uniref:proline rich transmembrane protein 1B-like n=1 Tax=Ambystoma mexicanum TaxID=8296 RepID=UPI0037E6F7E1